MPEVLAPRAGRICSTGWLLGFGAMAVTLYVTLCRVGVAYLVDGGSPAWFTLGFLFVVVPPVAWTLLARLAYSQRRDRIRAAVYATGMSVPLLLVLLIGAVVPIAAI